MVHQVPNVRSPQDEVAGILGAQDDESVTDLMVQLDLQGNFPRTAIDGHTKLSHFAEEP